jgi:D-sedoheptulose 7-phosphate isomerase
MKEQIIQTIQMHKKMVDNLETAGVEAIENTAKIIIGSIENGGVLYLCGNGGSAADCQHIAGEFIGRFLKERRALPAVALSTDTSILTCVGNY